MIAERTQREDHDFKIAVDAKIVHGAHYAVLHLLQWGVIRVVIEHQKSVRLDQAFRLADIPQHALEGVISVDVNPIECAVGQLRHFRRRISLVQNYLALRNRGVEKRPVEVAK